MITAQLIIDLFTLCLNLYHIYMLYTFFNNYNKARQIILIYIASFDVPEHENDSKRIASILAYATILKTVLKSEFFDLKNILKLKSYSYDDFITIASSVKFKSNLL